MLRPRVRPIVRRLSGSLVLLLLLTGLLITYPAWAESSGEQPGEVLVRVSPLTLLLENDVTIKVGDFTCQLVYGVDPSSVCSNLPPGEYQVSATAQGYMVMPPSYPLTIPGNPDDSEDGDSDDNDSKDEESEDEDADGEEDDEDAEAANAANEFYFRLYQINNELYMPNVHVKR